MKELSTWKLVCDLHSHTCGVETVFPTYGLPQLLSLFTLDLDPFYHATATLRLPHQAPTYW